MKKWHWRVAGMRIEPLMSFILMQDELLKAQPGRVFFPGDPSCVLNDVVTAGLGGAREDHIIHQITAITAFPYQCRPQWGYTHSGRPSFVPGPGAALPSFILRPRFQDSNENRWGGFQADFTVCHYTHTTPLYSPCPPPRHTNCRGPGCTFSHCARLKGSLAGDVEKSCVCLNMSLKCEWGVGEAC